MKNETSGFAVNISNLISRVISLQAARYFISSVIAFLVDYALLLTLERLMDGFSLAMEFSAVLAFAVSSQINFHINRHWVFRSEKNVFAEMGGYYTLAATSFLIKTFVLMEIMTRILLFPTWIAKPIAEAVMFVVNFFVQKLVIFKKNARKRDD